MEAKSVDMVMVIVSRKRAQMLSQKSAKFFPSAKICIAFEEVDEYLEYFPESRLVGHPNDIVGTGPVRQWVLDNFKNNIVVMIDDDIDVCYSQVGFKKRRIEDWRTIEALVERTAIAAKDSGARFFGYAVGSIPFSYEPFDPFSLCTWSDGVIGIIGKEVRYDTNLKLREDVDFALKTLQKDRYVFIDTRFLFSHDRFTASGGNSAVRTESRHEQEMLHLKKKWKNHIKIKKVKGTYKTTLNVER